MKSQLRLQEHSMLNDTNVVEIWHNGECIGVIYGGDGAGVRIITKHEIQCVGRPTFQGQPNIMEVLIHQ